MERTRTTARLDQGSPRRGEVLGAVSGDLSTAAIRQSISAFTNGKLCIVIQYPLGKGARCAPPFHPPSHGSSWASNPSRASGTYHRSITRRAWRRPSPSAPNHGSSELSRSPKPHSQGDFALPAPIDLGGVPAPKTPDHSMEAKDGSASPKLFRGAIPQSKERSCRYTSGRSSADWVLANAAASDATPQSGSIPSPPIPV